MTISQAVIPEIPADVAAAVAAVSPQLSVAYNPVGFDFVVRRAWDKADARHGKVKTGELGEHRYDHVDHFGADWNYPSPDAREQALARLVSRLQRFAPK